MFVIVTPVTEDLLQASWPLAHSIHSYSITAYSSLIKPLFILGTRRTRQKKGLY